MASFLKGLSDSLRSRGDGGAAAGTDDAGAGAANAAAAASAAAAAAAAADALEFARGPATRAGPELTALAAAATGRTEGGAGVGDLASGGAGGADVERGGSGADEDDDGEGDDAVSAELEGAIADVAADAAAAAAAAHALQPPQIFGLQNLPVLARADSELSVLTSNADRDEAALLLAALAELRRERRERRRRRRRHGGGGGGGADGTGRAALAAAADRILEAGDAPTRWLELLARELKQLGIGIPSVEIRYR